MISSEFESNVQKAIELLVINNKPLNNQEILNLFTENGIDKNDAVEIFYFLPIAFIRSIIPNKNWDETYIDFYGENEQVERKFKESDAFLLVLKGTQNYLSTSPSNDGILKIASISAEFNVMNPLLNNDPNLKPEDIILSKTIFIR